MRDTGAVVAKIVCVLYDDPVDGHPAMYARDSVPKIERYPGGQTAPTPRVIDFNPGEMLCDVSGALGLRRFSEDQGHTLIVALAPGFRLGVGKAYRVARGIQGG
jgi:formate dehydrogenase